jgi:CHRD domain-containing protein
VFRIAPELLCVDALITVGVMTKQLTKLMVAVAFAGAVVAGTITSCDDDSNNVVSTGTAGTGAVGGSGGTGGNNTQTFNMNLTASQEVPANGSTATGTVQVALNKTTGAINVTGSFSGLTTTVTAAHIHGPAAVGSTAPVIVPLTVTGDLSGTVTGTATMSTVQMSDMLNQMTYVNIHSMQYPDGEIRAQIK